MMQRIRRLQDELDEEKENTLKAELMLEVSKGGIGGGGERRGESNKNVCLFSIFFVMAK